MATPHDTPEAVDGYVSDCAPQMPDLISPAEAEVRAMNLLVAAAKARAYRIADCDETSGESPEPDFTRGAPAAADS